VTGGAGFGGVGLGGAGLVGGARFAIAGGSAFGAAEESVGTGSEDLVEASGSGGGVGFGCGFVGGARWGRFIGASLFG
jgi:hypothetical protein